jgi:hypothetical protein
MQKTIYFWIKDTIDALLEGMKTTLNFVKDFPATMKKFFCDIPEKFQPIF